MQINRLMTDAEIADQVVRELKEVVRANPRAVICIAGGDTPKPAMAKLVAANQSGDIDFSECRFVGLDEWVSISGETTGSCFQTLNDFFFSKLINVSKENIYFFNGKASPIEAECVRMNQFIEAEGPIDYLILGIGMNGLVGFNEPGAAIDNQAHIVDLDETTKHVMGKYFERDLPLEHGITLGLQQLLASRRITMIATGEHKAEIVEKTVNHEITTAIPSTVMRTSPHTVTLLVDQAAASKLTNE